MPSDALFPLLGATARFSEDGIYRYELSRRWAKGPMAAFVMLNSSTADAVKLDPTVRRCCGYAKSWGLGGIYVVNLFAFQTPYTKDLVRAEDPVGPENDEAIHDAAVRSRVVIVAWGAHPLARERAVEVLEMLKAIPGDRVRALATTKGGQPRHPLYLPRSLRPIPYP